MGRRNQHTWTKETAPKGPGRGHFKNPARAEAAKAAALAQAEEERAKKRAETLRLASIKALLQEAVAEHRPQVKAKLVEGLTHAEPKHMLGFARLAADYLDGPVSRVQPQVLAPVVVVFSHSKDWDPLAGPPPAEEAVFSEERPALLMPAPPRRDEGG